MQVHLQNDLVVVRDREPRLEPRLTKEHGARLIVSDDVMTALGDVAVTLKGYAAPVRAWRLA